MIFNHTPSRGETMKKRFFQICFFAGLLLSFSSVYAFADAREDLEARGVRPSDISKADMFIQENPEYKALQSVYHYCDLLENKKALAKEIVRVKNIKGRSGSPDYVTLRSLDSSYDQTINEIYEQKRLFKNSFRKQLNPSYCKNKDKYERQSQKLRDKLLIESFDKTHNSRIPNEAEKTIRQY